MSNLFKNIFRVNNQDIFNISFNTNIFQVAESLPDIEEADYVPIGIEFEYSETKQLGESHGELQTIVLPVSLYSCIKKVDETIPEKTRDFVLSNKFKKRVDSYTGYGE